MKAFNEISHFNFPPFYYDKIKEEIFRNSKEYILQVNEDEYINYLIEKYKLEPLAILTDQREVLKPVVRDITRNDMFGQPFKGKLYVFTVIYPFTGSSAFFKATPNPHQMSTYDIDVDSGRSTVSFDVSIFNQEKAEFDKAVSYAYERAFANLRGVNESFQNMIDSFPDMVRSIFLDIKKSYAKEESFFESINIRSNPKTSEVFSVPTITKKQIVQPKASPSKEFSSSPEMANAMYQEILNSIYQCGKNMEKKPSLYMGKDEEALRDQFIFVLETKYENTTATGETFNRVGKTDIMLRYAPDGSNLFVAECKVWHGASEMMKAVNQLLSYLTWRDSKVALILFVRNTGFSSVLKTIQSEIVTHPNFKKAIGDRGESSFSYIFGLPQDIEKDVFIEVMVFHYDK